MKQWPTTKLKNHVDKIGSGITPKGGEASYKMTGIPLIRSQNVLNNVLDLTNVAYIDEDQHDRMSGSKVMPNDILLNITGASIGRSCVVPFGVKDANVNQHVCIIRLKEDLNPLFLSSFINSWYGQKQIDSFQGGGSREGLNFKQIGSFDIPLPPLSEQRAIADILSTWDTAIETMERLIEVKEKYVYNIIAEFIGFLNKSSNTQFIQLGEILQYEQPTKYIVKDTEYNDNGTVPVLTANKSFILGYTLEEEDIFNKYPVIIFDDFTRDMKFVDFSFKIKSSAMKILHPKSTEINLYYVFLAMTQIEAPAGGHKRYWISEFQYKDIPYPDKEVQDDLTSRITLVNNEIKLLKQIVEKYKEQKRGLMQKLLTGEWRVKV